MTRPSSCEDLAFFTCAGEEIRVELISSSAGARERSCCIHAQMLTTRGTRAAFINI